MVKKKEQELILPSLDDLFTSQKTRDDTALSKIREIPINEIDDFPDHPFKVQDDDAMFELVQSIQEYGVITPALVRKKDNERYELISGHRRKRASILIGLDKLRCEIVEVDKDAATIAMVDSNLQRTKILPSEKAFSYKMRLEAMKRQGKRTDLTSVPVAQKLTGKTSRQILSEQVGESADNIRRYIRLTELIPALLATVDEGQIGLRPAVEISYLPVDLQTVLYETMQAEVCTPSHAQTIRMRSMLKDGVLTEEAIREIMLEEKPNQKERIVLKNDRIKALIPKNIPMEKRESYIIKALEYYFKHKVKENER